MQKNIFIAMALIFWSQLSFAQLYYGPAKGNFRTIGSGNYTNANIWEKYNTSNGTWELHKGYPLNPYLNAGTQHFEGQIHIRTGDIVSLDTTFYLSRYDDNVASSLVIDGKLDLNTHSIIAESQYDTIMWPTYKNNLPPSLTIHAGAWVTSDDSLGLTNSLQGFYPDGPQMNYTNNVGSLGGYGYYDSMASYDMFFTGNNSLRSSLFTNKMDSLRLHVLQNCVTDSIDLIVKGSLIYIGSNLTFTENSTLTLYHPMVNPNLGVILNKVHFDSTSTLRLRGSSDYEWSNALLGNLEMDADNNVNFILHENVTLFGTKGLKLNGGKINTNGFWLQITDSLLEGGNANSYVIGTLKSLTKSNSVSDYHYVSFPVGTANYFHPIRMNILTQTNYSEIITAKVFEDVPIGAADKMSIGGNLINRYWTVKASTYPHRISAISNIELQPTSPNPALTLNSIVGVSANNSINYPFQGIASSVSPPYITSLQLDSTQIEKMYINFGLYIGVGYKPLSTGEYCIGPSPNYAPPSGSPNYINANSPYLTISSALDDLQTRGCNGPITFVLQNDYTMAGESNPISISYKGDSLRTLTIKPRTDNVTPIILSNSSSNGVGILQFNGAEYVKLLGSTNNICGNYGIRIINNGSPSNLAFGNGTTCINLINDSKHITISGVQFEVTDIGIRFDNNSTISGAGSDSITISCNKFVVRPDLLNFAPAYYVPTGIRSSHNQIVNPTATSNDILIQYNHFENMSYGIYLQEGIAGAHKILDNHFYRNINTTPAPSFNSFIYCGKPVDFLIDGNYFGGSTTNCGGAKMNLTANTQYLLLLEASSPSSTTKSVLSNNHFENIIQNTGATLYFVNLSTSSCVWNIIGNNFGNPNVTDDISLLSNYTFYGVYSITSSNATTNNLISNIHNNSFNNITCSSGTGAYFYGFYLAGPTSSIKNNNFKNIAHSGQFGFQMIYSTNFTPLAGQINEFSYNTAENILQANTTSSNDAIGIFRIENISGYPVNLSCVGNRIGSLTNSNDIVFNGSLIRPFKINIWTKVERADSNIVCNVQCTNANANAAQTMMDIFAPYTESCAYNTIFNCDSKSKFVVAENANSYSSLNGLALNNSGVNSSTESYIHHNKIYNLNNSNTGTQTGGLSVIGLLMFGNATNINFNIHNNEIYSLTNQAISSGSNPYIYGLSLGSPRKAIVYNNRILLSNGSYTNVVNLNGMKKYYSNNQPFTFYHNTIAVYGLSVTGSNSFCMFKNTYNSGKDTMKNNIFYNARTGSGLNYCLGSDYNVVADWGKSDYNAFFSADVNQMGKWLNSTMPFATWKTTTSTEANSVLKNVHFVDLANDDLHLNPNTNCLLNHTGTYIASMTTDIDGDNRNNPPTIGADEFTYITPTVTASAINNSVCATDNIELQSATSSPLSTFYYSWLGPNSFSSVLPSPIISNAQNINQGIYSLTVTDNYGCGASNTVSIAITPQLSWYYDQDGDGYYTGNATMACNSPGQYYTTSVLGNNDCDDLNPNIHPNAPEICGNNIDDDCDGQVYEGCTLNDTLAGKIFIQGYYLGSGLMQPVLYNQGESLTDLITDTIFVELRNEFNTSLIEYSNSTILGIDGEFSIVGIPPTLIGNSYYLVVRHRNSIETWSENPISITSYTYYNFTNAVSKAAGNNQIEMESNTFAIYSGDVNQDGTIDIFDFLEWDFDNQNFSSGYYATDINGDGNVDIFDFLIWDPNNQNFIGVITP